MFILIVLCIMLDVACIKVCVNLHLMKMLMVLLMACYYLLRLFALILCWRLNLAFRRCFISMLIVTYGHTSGLRGKNLTLINIGFLTSVRDKFENMLKLYFLAINTIRHRQTPENQIELYTNLKWSKQYSFLQKLESRNRI